MKNVSKERKYPTLRSRLTAFGLGSTAVFLVLCVGFLLLLVFNVTKPFVQSDLDFALKETSNNLSSRVLLLADIMLELRRDSVLMEALAGEGLTRKDGTDDSVTEIALKNTVEIYSSKNTDHLDTPFLDAVYLFDREGSYNRVSYLDLIDNVQQSVDRRFYDFYKAFVAQESDTLAIIEQERLMVAHTLYNSIMEPCGTVIFAVSIDAVEQVMRKNSEYKGAFWFLFDSDGKQLMGAGDALLSDDDRNAIAKGEKGKTYLYKSAGTDYLVWVQPMSMGVGSAQGISYNQLSLLLFDSVKYYALGIVAALLLLGVLLFVIIMRITRPLEEIASKLELVAQKKFDTKLPKYDVQEYAAIADTFNSMTEVMNYLINDVYEKRLLAMNIEMKFLQSQVNPHFLYNVLNTIALKARMDGNVEVSDMASNFALLTQARLNNSGDEKVTLEQEMQYVRFYLELQKSRFEDKMQYYINIEDESLLSFYIPKLTIELLVENAVLHGIERKTEPGTVYVQLYGSAEGVEVLVEDDGVGFEGQDREIILPLPDKKAGEGHNHIALNNAWKLLRHYYGEKYGITIQSRPQVGTRVTVTIPYDKEGDDVPYHHSR